MCKAPQPYVRGHRGTVDPQRRIAAPLEARARNAHAAARLARAAATRGSRHAIGRAALAATRGAEGEAAALVAATRGVVALLHMHM